MKLNDSVEISKPERHVGSADTPLADYSLVASFRASLSVANRLIRPAGLSPVWLSGFLGTRQQ
jgi:hypothetical protein